MLASSIGMIVPFLGLKKLASIATSMFVFIERPSIAIFFPKDSATLITCTKRVIDEEKAAIIILPFVFFIIFIICYTIINYLFLSDFDDEAGAPMGIGSRCAPVLSLGSLDVFSCSSSSISSSVSSFSGGT